MGEGDGMLGKDYDEKIKDLLKEYNQLPEEKRWHYRFLKGYETDHEVVTRFITHLREISVGYAGKTVLVVTHGGSIRILLTKLGYAPYGTLVPGTFKNAGHVVLESDGVDFFVKEVQGIRESKRGRSTL